MRALVGDLTIDRFNQRGAQRFQRPDLVDHAQAHSRPVARLRQRGDRFELRRHYVLDGDETRKRRRVGLRLRRQAAQSVFAATAGGDKSLMKSLHFTHREGSVIGMRQRIQPLMKGHEIDMRL